MLGRANGLTLFAMWTIQLSVANMGQVFWGYGWESQLMETGKRGVFTHCLSVFKVSCSFSRCLCSPLGGIDNRRCLSFGCCDCWFGRSCSGLAWSKSAAILVGKIWRACTITTKHSRFPIHYPTICTHCRRCFMRLKWAPTGPVAAALNFFSPKVLFNHWIELVVPLLQTVPFRATRVFAGIVSIIWNETGVSYYWRVL